MPSALIVDGDSANLASLADLFEHIGYTVETTGRLGRVREALLERVPEVALFNEHLEGEDVMGELERVDLGSVMAIYLMTDAPTLEGATRAMRLGAADYFEKPIDAHRLARHLRGIVEELGAHRGGRRIGTTECGEPPPMQRLFRVAVGTSLAEVERRTILATLEHLKGDKKRAADVLGISLKTLYNRLNAYKQADASGQAR